MGTNYEHRACACTCCDHGGSLHLGKQSAGHPFTLRVYDNDDGPKDEAAWRERLAAGGIVRDEYGREFLPETLLALLDTKGVWEQPREFS